MSATAADLADRREETFFASTIGKKAAMAVSGLILFGFVLGHLAGNLQIYEGPEKINHYAAFLRSMPALLWGARITLLVMVTLHIWSAVALAVRNNAARPIGYVKKKSTKSTYASRTMYWSGPIVLAFVIFHLLHLTAGYIHPGAAFIEGDVYHNVVAGFQVWWVSVWYIFSIILLGLHLRHGIWSMFQSLGMNHPRHTPILKSAAWVIALVIVLGYISIPISVMLGVVK
jgi:succinate dehydrogenase / fumarate reductase, cytochrome b subunit